MSQPTIHGKKPVFSASKVLEEVGAAISRIKVEDGLTWADVGAVLGKSDDQARKYADGEADMGLVSFARGMREWNGRFSGDVRRLCEETRPGVTSDRMVISTLLKAATSLSEALDNSNDADLADAVKNRATLEKARDALDGVLGRLKPGVVA